MNNLAPVERVSLLLISLIAASCSAEDQPSAPLEGTLSLELRDEVAVRMEPASTPSLLRVTITASTGFGLLPANQPLSATGRIEAFPEAGATLYTAKFSAPPQPSGPCAEAPISIALALHRPGNNATVVGGLSAYCGADSWSGKPVRILRLAGSIPLNI